METYEIFWTGGFDSTFRVVQLSRLPIRIQPVYCTGIASDVRKSEFYELRAIKQIMAMLKEKPETKAEFLPLKVVSKTPKPEADRDPGFVYDILPYNHSVAVAYRKLYIAIVAPIRNQLLTGRGGLNATNLDKFIESQYQWLASYANSREKPVEIGISAKFVNKYLEAVGASDAIEEIDNGVFKQYILKKDKCRSLEGSILFGNFAFPFYHALTKPELVGEYKRLGYEDVMNQTWFCFDPIDGKPCGQCWTCIHTYRDGITNRFSPEALERYLKREKELANENSDRVER